jgi:hypothetical protein
MSITHPTRKFDACVVAYITGEIDNLSYTWLPVGKSSLELRIVGHDELRLAIHELLVLHGLFRAAEDDIENLSAAYRISNDMCVGAAP